MASGSISSPGVGSNLDVSGIVSKLMSIEQRPLNNLNLKEATLQARFSLLGQIKSAVSGIQTASRSLSSSASTQTLKATSSDSNIVSPTTSGGAAIGSYALTVTRIAQAQRIAAAGQVSQTAAIGTGAASTVTISFGSIVGGTLDGDTGLYSGATFTANADKTPVSIDIDATNNTLEGIRDAINAASAGVTASIVADGSATPYRLLITSNDTGETNSIKIDVSGDATLQGLLSYDASGTQNMSQLQLAQSAALTVNGIVVTSASNSVAGVIPNLTFELKAAGSVTVSVSQDNTPLTTALTQLVKAYNDASSAIGEATRKGANLQGDTGTISMLARLRAELGSLRVGFGSYGSLSALGVSFERDGTLSFDPAKLQSALAADFTHVTGLVASIADAVNLASEGMAGASGGLQAKSDGIARSIKDIDSRRESISRRLEQVQARYLAQFNALDTLMASMTQTSAYLEQQLANLPKIGS